MADLHALLDRVKAATGPDRELDAEVCAALRYIGALGDQHMWTRDWKGPIVAKGARVVLVQADGSDGPWTQAPAVTGSLDAVLALVGRVLPGAVRALTERNDTATMRSWLAEVYPLDAPGRFSARAPTPALALLAALLSALIHQREPAHG